MNVHSRKEGPSPLHPHISVIPSSQICPLLLFFSCPQARGSAYEPKVPGFGFRFDYISPQHPVVQKILKVQIRQLNNALFELSE